MKTHVNQIKKQAKKVIKGSLLAIFTLAPFCILGLLLTSSGVGALVGLGVGVATLPVSVPVVEKFLNTTLGE